MSTVCRVYKTLLWQNWIICSIVKLPFKNLDLLILFLKLRKKSWLYCIIFSKDLKIYTIHFKCFCEIYFLNKLRERSLNSWFIVITWSSYLWQELCDIIDLVVDHHPEVLRVFVLSNLGQCECRHFFDWTLLNPRRWISVMYCTSVLNLEWS